MFLTRAPLVVHDTLTDARLTKTGLAALGFESLLALPLLAQGETLGVMLVDYRDDAFSYESGSTVHEERLTVVQGIAHQAAAAIENALLREAQQQEAYVSNALFQVAQTVANLSNLDDILSAIVRVTPILVGVERCVLLLWVRREGCFRVSHVYGVSHEGEEHLLSQRYATGDFEFLDTIYELNEPLTYASPNGLGGRTDDPDTISPAFAQAIGYQTAEYPPLLGFPLAVRGDVLGILLLEEAQAPANLREKRLEIISGIAQQAALALQNAQLQEERVGRERMGQELALAREIQQSLIPETLAQVEGWDLAALWRAARETSGDFYDLIPLPGGKLGLLIGDVADKGMPAALFMVLTRTLVRATALTTGSPAQVLGQVNDLLVPDAKAGMFVTAFYAVLAPDQGTFTYANAGHTPAFVRRAGGAAPEMLTRGGMALGVLEGTRVEERVIRLAEGDTIVLSTDGVTEAYSPQGELFGLQGLADTVARASATSADGVLAHIERAVAEHVENAPAADDLTLLVLRRSRSPR